MIPDLNIVATVVRSVSRADRVVVVATPTAPPFFVSLVPPTSSKESDGSPRSLPPYKMRYRAGVLGGPSMGAGWRVALNRPLGRPYENAVYELLAAPKEFRSGAVTDGIEAVVAPMSILYPYIATLHEQNGSLIGTTIPVALWDDRESQQSTGTYEDFSGEAPGEFAGQLKGNRYILIGTTRYRILTELIDYEGPRVKFTARMSNA